MAQQFDLNKTRIATPCHMSWNEMKGDDRVRHCGSCQLNVYNVAGLTNQQAQELLQKRASGERVCMRLTRRADGTILTRDCPTGISLARRAKLRVLSLSASAFALILTLFSTRTSAQDMGEKIEPKRVALMGKVAAPPQPDHTILGGVVAMPQPAPDDEIEQGEPTSDEPWTSEDVPPTSYPED